MAAQIFGDPSDFDGWLGDTTDLLGEEYDTEHLPVLPLRDTVIYPQMMAPLLVGREHSLSAVEKAMEGNQRLVVIAQRDEAIQEPEADDLFTIGTEIVIGRKLRMPDGTLSIWVQGQRRVRVIEYTQMTPISWPRSRPWARPARYLCRPRPS